MITNDSIVTYFGGANNRSIADVLKQIGFLEHYTHENYVMQCIALSSIQSYVKDFCVENKILVVHWSQNLRYSFFDFAMTFSRFCVCKQYSLLRLALTTVNKVITE